VQSVSAFCTLRLVAIIATSLDIRPYFRYKLKEGTYIPVDTNIWPCY
jgi:hypothetical protein